jgi:hypothetical protein
VESVALLHDTDTATWSVVRSSGLTVIPCMTVSIASPTTRRCHHSAAPAAAAAASDLLSALQGVDG